MSCDCLDGTGYGTAEATRAGALSTIAIAKTALAGGEVAVSLLNAKQAFDKKNAVKSQLTSIEEQQQNHLKDTFWPKELDFLDEFTEGQDLEDIDVKARRHTGRLISTLSHKFADKLREIRCRQSRYCTSAREKQITDLYDVQSKAVANARILGYVMGFMDVQRKKDLHDQRRLQAIGLGRKLMDKAATLYGQAVQSLDMIGQQTANTLNSSLEHLGYEFNQYKNIRENAPTMAPTPGQKRLDQSSPLAWKDTNNFLANMNASLDSMYGENLPDSSFKVSNANSMNGGAAYNTPMFSILHGGLEEHMNNGIVDNVDKTLTGTATFPVVDDTVEVDLTHEDYSLWDQQKRCLGDTNEDGCT